MPWMQVLKGRSTKCASHTLPFLEPSPFLLLFVVIILPRCADRVPRVRVREGHALLAEVLVEVRRVDASARGRVDAARRARLSPAEVVSHDPQEVGRPLRRGQREAQEREGPHLREKCARNRLVDALRESAAR